MNGGLTTRPCHHFPLWFLLFHFLHQFSELCPFGRYLDEENKTKIGLKVAKDGCLHEMEPLHFISRWHALLSRSQRMHKDEHAWLQFFQQDRCILKFWSIKRNLRGAEYITAYKNTKKCSALNGAPRERKM